MTFRTLILRSLRFRARAHLGVVLGAAVGSAALIGALVVGDSVRESLRERALERLGSVHYALAAGDRMFRAHLAEDLGRVFLRRSGRSTGDPFAAALLLPATAAAGDGSARANQVQLIGIDSRFATVGEPRWTNGVPSDQVVLNEPLAAQLRARPGDEVLLRVGKPTTLSRDNPLAPQSDARFVLRLRVSDVVSAADLGDLSLQIAQVPALNAFVDLPTLQRAAGVTYRANVILAGPILGPESKPISRPHAFVRNWFAALTGRPSRVVASRQDGRTQYFLHSERRVVQSLSPDYFSSLLRSAWRLEDAELVLREAPGGTVELRSPRVFLDPAVAGRTWLPRLPGQSGDFPTNGNIAVFNASGQLLAQPNLDRLVTNWNQTVVSNAQPILTYLVNQFRAGERATPYSMVTAAREPWVPAGMADDEILVNQWLADDLKVQPGSEITLTWFDPDAGGRLLERTNVFRVRGIVPMTLPWADRTLMPDFPGIEKADSTHDWDAGFPLVHRIRDEDEAYWKQWRGTPKAFVTLAAGRRMWSNRFGDLTALRFPVPAEAAATNAAQVFRTVLERKLLNTLPPDALGLRFEPVREQALQGAVGAQDFGQLFLGFSFFLILAALLLMALLFQLGLEQRLAEVGTLLAVGFTPRQVRLLLWAEGTALALLGGGLGALAGLAYARALLTGLTTIWRDAIGASALRFHVTTGTLAIGLVASVIVSALTIALVLRRQAKRPARELLAEGAAEAEAQSSKLKAQKLGRAGWIGVLALLGALALVGVTALRRETAAAGVFFGVGTLLLVAGLAFTAAWLNALNRAGAAATLSVNALGLRGATRRRKRSLAVVGLLACGSFLIVAIGAFKLDANRDAWRRSAGTGGFALIGQSTLPVLRDLNTPAGREFYALDDAALAGVSFVPLRVRDGDDASCLNLNRARQPRLLGVQPELLADRGAFTFAKVAKDISAPPGWLLLRADGDSEPIPAIGDLNSILWAMGRKVGDTLDYVDERGQPFRIRIVGAVANSILQGSLLIDEAAFIRRFPGESGYRMFLVDAPSNAVTEVSAVLGRAFRDVGLELTPAARRLEAFNAVQNTYLNTFQVLGGIGLLLGSAGLGVVVLRNVLERRGELGLLQAVGFRRRTLQWLVLSEHAALLWLGLGVGVVAAVVAVLPALRPGADFPVASLAVTLAAVLGSGLLWTWAATWMALRGRLLEALRNE